MKYFFYSRPLWAVSFFLIVTSSSSRAQQKVNAKTYQRFLNEYHARGVIKNNDEIKTFRPDSMVHPFVIATMHFSQEKVLPNQDAVQLLQELNPSVDMSDKAKLISGETQLVYPNYPPPKEKVLMQFKAEYRRASLPDDMLNSSFIYASTAFNKIFKSLNIPATDAEKKFYDSLSFLNNRILPYINNTARSISQTQMRYLNSELQALNRTLSTGKEKAVPKNFKTKNTSNRNIDHSVASYVVADFYALTSSAIKRKKEAATGQQRLHNSFLEFASYRENSLDKNYSTEDNNSSGYSALNSLQARPFACNLYVYSTDENGNRKKDPEMYRYDVWLGDRATYMINQKAPDPSSYGFIKMGNPASTLPFTIGLGTWVVIMKERGTGKIYNKEISIVSETETDEDDPNTRKVCYTVN
jgi:hypothetical protein